MDDDPSRTDPARADGPHETGLAQPHDGAEADPPSAKDVPQTGPASAPGRAREDGAPGGRSSLIPPPPAVSSYTDRAAAEASTARALEANRAEVERWLASSSGRLAVGWKADTEVGHAILNEGPPRPVVPARDVVVVLSRSSESALGYFVLTSYPDWAPPGPSAPTVRTRYPTLWQLFGAWFNQDWDTDVGVWGDWPDVVDAFVAAEGEERVSRAVAELDGLLAAVADGEELRRSVARLGSYCLPPAELVRGWLGALRRELAQRSGATPAR